MIGIKSINLKKKKRKNRSDFLCPLAYSNKIVYKKKKTYTNIVTIKAIFNIKKIICLIHVVHRKYLQSDDFIGVVLISSSAF